jgi:TolA-binding protein
MQKLAGLITESEYKTKLEEGKELERDIKTFEDKIKTFEKELENAKKKIAKEKSKKNPNQETIERYLEDVEFVTDELKKDRQALKSYQKELKSEKESLNEHYVAGGIVGIGAITQIPSREKTDYEMAFEHFLGERYLTKFENREQDLEEGKEEEDLDEGKEVEEPSLYEEEVSMNGGQSISQIQDEWLQVTTDIARLAAEYKKPKPDMQAALALGDQLKAKARLKQKLENEINNSIAGNDRDIRLIITQLT